VFPDQRHEPGARECSLAGRREATAATPGRRSRGGAGEELVELVVRPTTMGASQGARAISLARRRNGLGGEFSRPDRVRWRCAGGRCGAGRTRRTPDPFRLLRVGIHRTSRSAELSPGTPHRDRYPSAERSISVLIFAVCLQRARRRQTLINPYRVGRNATSGQVFPHRETSEPEAARKRGNAYICSDKLFGTHYSYSACATSPGRVGRHRAARPDSQHSSTTDAAKIRCAARSPRH